MAKQDCDKHTGYQVYDYQGKVVYTKPVAYIVQAGAYSVKENAVNKMDAIKKAGFDAIIINENDTYYVQCGSFKIKDNADKLALALLVAGFETYIKEKK